MITCVIQYTLDPHAIDDFEEYALVRPPIIEHCGGRMVGFYLPAEGADDFALALFDFDSLTAYERYREQLAADPRAQETQAAAWRSRCIQAERRSFLRKI